MGIIIKESIKSSVISYVGVVIGFINVGLLQPHLLSPDHIGYLSIIVTLSELISQIFSLGIPSIISKYFPWFKMENKIKGIKLILAIALILGSILSYLLIFIFSDYIINNFGNNDFKNFINLDFSLKIIFLWVLSNLVFKLYDSTYKMLFKISLSFFLKDVLQKIMMTIALILYYFKLIDFKAFVLINLIGVSIPAVIIFIKISLNPDFVWTYYIPKQHKKEIINVALFSLIGSLGSVIISQIDKIMIGSISGLSQTGIYTIMGYYAIIIIIPSRALKKISIPVIAESWKNKDLNNIESVYKSSSANLFFIGSMMLSLLILNTDAILYITGKEEVYEAGRLVPLIIGIGYLFDLFTGVNSEIISTSSKYKWTMLFTLGTAVITIGLNLLLIPKIGMLGAAIGSMITFIIINLLRLTFVYKSFKIHPFSGKIFKMLLMLVLPALMYLLLPKFENVILASIIKSIFIISYFIAFNYLVKISPEINNLLITIITKLKNKR